MTSASACKPHMRGERRLATQTPLFTHTLLEVPVSIAAAGGMSGPSASASAAAGGGGYSNIFGFINHSGTQGDEQSRFCASFGRLLTLHEHFIALQTQMGDTIRHLAAKGSVCGRRLAMLERATADISDALGPLKDGLRGLNGVALLEGHSKTFALVTPDDEEANAVAEKTTETTQTKKKVEVDAKRRRIDAPPVEPSGAADPPFLPGLPDIPTDVMGGTLLPFISGHRDDPATLTPHNTIALCRTSEAVSSTVAAALVADIDSIIRRDGLTGVIGYAPLRRSTGVRRPFRLIRLHYLMVTGGDWTGNVPLLRIAESCGRVQQLPIQLRKNDLRRAGSKAVIDSRPPSMRQYALFSHRLGNWMQLRRTANGRDRLDRYVVTVHTKQTVPVRYRDRFDAADPPCHYDALECGSFRGLVINRLALLSSRLVSDRSYSPSSAEYRRICALVDQEPPLWDGCRTIDYHYNTIGPSYRLVILCGEEEGDDFAASIRMIKWPDGLTYIDLRTTEAPQPGGSGPAAFSRTVAKARNKMDGPALALPSAI
ncbi:unnamed protein product [Vitrella brassicaformis CCMP3155]|uniref:Uncharacterized protein n=1 Tax=Vitrella brassicaformis (strain CCMP3155) TaxID=1169540 RepID=A0A0G4EG61_VITBC|nr:unnamed protein product [Vitrella brassicaformis CCMP3155]|eukprot:CEL94371.1 unnamed protein product [Vitrella brassicaformis CCMP3155]